MKIFDAFLLYTKNSNTKIKAPKFDHFFKSKFEFDLTTK